MTVALHTKPEIVIPGKRLGRHVEHDERSRCFSSPVTGPIVSRSWARHCAPFDQSKPRDLGSCTGNALIGLMMTEPFYVPGRVLTEADAIALYSEATRLDKIPGHYPPEDTGSSGVAVAKAAVRRGYFTNYRHAFSLQAALVALGRAPIIIGIDWYEGFDAPSGVDGRVTIGGQVRGGHEIEVLASDVGKKLVRFCQSWGTGWGDHGYGTMTFDTLARLLEQHGDATAPEPD